jgi:multicomponent Na+:H+ antiporter subunit C
MTDLSLETVLYTGAIGLAVIGVAGLVLCHDLFRMVLALVLAEAGANLLLVLAGYRPGAVAPILDPAAVPSPMVDPVPQAMVLTAIVIDVGVQALAVAILLRVKRAYGTLDMRELKGLMEGEIDRTAGIESARSQDAPAGERPLPPAGPAPSSAFGESRP